jgi:hypothetical protein
MTNAQILATLDGDALAAATAFLDAFPDGVLTSGGRGVQEQAHAMASNVVKQRDWILGTPGKVKGTYVWSVGAQRLHNWAITHSVVDLGRVFDAFVLILTALSPAERAAVSKHFGRAAFDVQPQLEQDGETPTARGAQMVAWLKAKALELGGRFLEREGNLVRWHWQAA